MAKNQTGAKKRMFILDAMALAFRNYHAFSRNPLRTEKGFPTSAIFGTAQFLTKIIQEEKPDLFVVACDSAEKTFRHDLYPEYKANRTEMPTDLSKQLPGIFRLFEALQIPMIRTPGFEADDIVGTLVHQHANENLECFIISGDKDFMQLINPHVKLYSQKQKGEIVVVDEQGVHQKFGCKPDQVIDVLALIGDSSDNVPGVAGIGEKGAATLISKFHSLDGIYDHLEEITNKRQKNGLTDNKEMAYLSKELVTIKTDMDLELTLDDFVYQPEAALANEELLGLYEEFEFRNLINNTKKRIAEKTPGENPKEEKPRGQARDYKAITSLNELRSYLNLIMDKPYVAFDTETTGLNVITDEPIGVSLSAKPFEARYIPLCKEHNPELDYDAFVAELKSFFENEDGPRKIAHNFKYDFQMLKNIGIEVKGQAGDTMLQAFILDSTAPTFGLDGLSESNLGVTKIPTSELIGKKGERSMKDVETATITEYACEDADCVLRLFEIFSPSLVNKGLHDLYEDVEVPLAKVIAKMEQAGIFVDGDELAEFSNRLGTEVERLKKIIYEEAGEEFNINSPKQLQVILFEKLKIHEQLEVKRIKKTKSGFSTDVTVLQQLSKHPLPAALLEYRSVYKLKNTYVDTLPQLITPESGRIHTSFHQSGTATGRLSSSNPNLQNIPIRTELGREIRKAFSAPKGKVIVSADYSQVELRILAHMADDEGLKEAFASGKDIHTATAAKMFKMDIDKVDSDLRSRAKAINYGLIYGMGPQRLARETKVSVAEAKSFIESYFESFPNIQAFIDSAIESATEKGYSTTLLKRRRPIKGLDESNGLAAVNARNMAVNSPIQGSAADLIKLAMLEIDKQLESRQLKARMLLQVHDELVFECEADQAEKVMELVKSCMESAMDLNVPIVADIGKGNNWLEAH